MSGRSSGPVGTSSCLEFAPGMAKAFLYPRPGYVPKVLNNAQRPIVLQALCPLPFRSTDQEKLRSQDCSVEEIQAVICLLWFAQEGFPGDQAYFEHVDSDTVSLTYKLGKSSPVAVRAHSTWGMAASKALASGASLQDVCNAAGWPLLGSQLLLP